MLGSGIIDVGELEMITSEIVTVEELDGSPPPMSRKRICARWPSKAEGMSTETTADVPEAGETLTPAARSWLTVGLSTTSRV